MDPVDPQGLHRHDDPGTSKKAAMANPRTRLNQQQQLLQAHGDAFLANPDLYEITGMTCDEAWLAIPGKTIPSISCYWHRHSDLADKYDPSLLRRMTGPHGNTVVRPGVSGHDREVFILEPEGFDYYLEHLSDRD